MLLNIGCDPEEGVALVEQFERDKEKMKLTLQEELEQLKMAYQVDITRTCYFNKTILFSGIFLISSSYMKFQQIKMNKGTSIMQCVF